MDKTRVRIARPFYWKGGDRRMIPGQIVTVPADDAQLWLRHGIAMQDKTVDVSENKAESVIEVKPKPKPKHKTRK